MVPASRLGTKAYDPSHMTAGGGMVSLAVMKSMPSGASPQTTRPMRKGPSSSRSWPGAAEGMTRMARAASRVSGRVLRAGVWTA